HPGGRRAGSSGLHRHRVVAGGDGSGRRRPRDASRARGAGAIMIVFVAGGTGTLGLPLVRALVAEGHTVTALTRSRSKGAEIEAIGARPAVADALDASALQTALQAARPTHVIHEL